MAIKLLCFGFAVLIATLIVHWGHHLYDRVWVKGYPPINYLDNSQPNRDRWRWRKPHSTLHIPYQIADRPGIWDSSHVSSFGFRPQFRFADILSPIAGLLLIGCDILLIINSTVTAANFLTAFALFLGLFCLGFFFLQYGDRVQQINLYPDRIEIIAKFAIFIPRTTTYHHQQILNIRGKLQSFWTKEAIQTQPDYNLIIIRPHLSYFQRSHTFHLRCNPSQGAWIVGGLTHWKSLSSQDRLS